MLLETAGFDDGGSTEAAVAAGDFIEASMQTTDKNSNGEVGKNNDLVKGREGNRTGQ